MIKKCLQLSFTALTLMATLLCVSLNIVEADLATDTPSHKSESIPVPVSKDSVLHLIPEQTLGLIYCPNLLELDNSIRTLKTGLLSEPQASNVSAEILSDIFGSQFEDLIALEAIFNVNRDFAIVLTSLKPLQFAVLAHLKAPEAIKQIIEKVTQDDERTEYKGVTYWNDDEDAESLAILENILIVSKQRVRSVKVLLILITEPYRLSHKSLIMSLSLRIFRKMPISWRFTLTLKPLSLPLTVHLRKNWRW